MQHFAERAKQLKEPFQLYACFLHSLLWWNCAMEAAKHSCPLDIKGLHKRIAEVMTDELEAIGKGLFMNTVPEGAH